METSHQFSFELWERDIEPLGGAQRELARQALVYARETLSCWPYHRRSKDGKPSDHQTLFKHPKSRRTCLVLSVVPSETDRSIKVLRVDFFDRHECVTSDLAPIQRAPRGQWTNKHERRMYVPPATTSKQLNELLGMIVTLANVRA